MNVTSFWLLSCYIISQHTICFIYTAQLDLLASNSIVDTLSEAALQAKMPFQCLTASKLLVP